MKTSRLFWQRHNLSKKTFLSIVAILTIVIGCASDSTKTDSREEKIPGFTEDEYHALIKDHTQFARKYDGFFEVFELHALLVDSDVQDILTQRQAHFMGWDTAHIQREKEKTAQQMSSQTRVILSFFSPDYQYDDLAKVNSVWGTYLEADGKRYEGKAKRISTKLAELRDLFPFHNRFSTAYEVIFPVAVTKVEQGPSSFVMTSTLGTATLKFEPVKHRN